MQVPASARGRPNSGAPPPRASASPCWVGPGLPQQQRRHLLERSNSLCFWCALVAEVLGPPRAMVTGTASPLRSLTISTCLGTCGAASTRTRSSRWEPAFAKSVLSLSRIVSGRFAQPRAETHAMREGRATGSRLARHRPARVARTTPRHCGPALGSCARPAPVSGAQQRPRVGVTARLGGATGIRVGQHLPLRRQVARGIFELNTSRRAAVIARALVYPPALEAVCQRNRSRPVGAVAEAGRMRDGAGCSARATPERDMRAALGRNGGAR